MTIKISHLIVAVSLVALFGVMAQDSYGESLWLAAPRGVCYPDYDPEVFLKGHDCARKATAFLEGGLGSIIIYECQTPNRKEVVFADTLHACQKALEAIEKQANYPKSKE